MATTTIDSNRSDNEYGYRFEGDGDELIVNAGVRVEALNPNGIGIYALFSQQTIRVNGTVVGGGDTGNGVMMGGNQSSSQGNTLVVGSGGLVQAGLYGAVLYGSESTVINEGRIEGGFGGVLVSATGPASVENRGTISGASYGVLISDQSGGLFGSTVSNHGSLLSAVTAFQGTGQTDAFRNYGTVEGNIQLGGGNDLFDSRGGTLTGTVYGEDGDDRFFAGAGAEVFYGGAGEDTLDFRDAEGLSVSLATRTGTGAAQGDLYDGFENVIGSDGGNDSIIGNAAANVLDGLAGNDRLDGRVGRDILIGSLGQDRLIGGKGNDLFVFLGADEGGDRIVDFGSVRGNNDRIGILAESFGLAGEEGLLDPSRFRSGTSNRAGDAGDRFIFRTTDKTLWFDADGRGGDGPILLADLQNDARLTAHDILLL